MTLFVVGNDLLESDLTFETFHSPEVARLGTIEHAPSSAPSTASYEAGFYRVDVLHCQPWYI
jgi:hypothetical protein